MPRGLSEGLLSGLNLTANFTSTARI